MLSSVPKIISGGQTGADRAALDLAIAFGMEYGGFVPRHRLTEDGRLPSKYAGMTETVSADNTERTELNVINSDATLIVSNGELSGGSKLTKRFARKHKKPILHLDLTLLTPESAADKARLWLTASKCETLNVAGPRASKDPTIYGDTLELLKLIFG